MEKIDLSLKQHNDKDICCVTMILVTDPCKTNSLAETYNRIYYMCTVK
jgi:hypothetical protein